MTERCNHCRLKSVICCEIGNSIFCKVCCPNHKKRPLPMEAEVRIEGEDQNMTQEDFRMFCEEAEIDIADMSPEQMMEHKHTLMDAIKRLKVHVQVTIRSINIAQMEMTAKEKADLNEYDKKYQSKAKNIDGEKKKRQTSNEKLIQMLMKEHGIEREDAVAALSLVMKNKAGA